MFDLLSGIYAKADTECNVDITFSPTPDGKQQNDCRDLVVSYMSKPDLSKGRKIAERLAEYSDGRSGLGLLFLISGREGRDHKIVLSRFPTDSAIYVDETPGTLSVQFLERVFMKSKTSYKAVLYQHASLQGGFWFGRAIDKQLNTLLGEPSNYWINDFLLSDFTTTPAMGTRRLAIALRDAAKKASLDIKQELTAAGTLASGLAGQRLNIDDFGKRLGLSDAAKNAIKSELKSSAAAQEVFQFDIGTYRSLVAFKSVELSNGALLTADTEKFDEVFEQEPVEGSKDEIKFVTRGQVIDEKLKTAR
ncbi:hypothetical protein [Bradyrhizobium sp. CCBAU 51765]|uniref:hypothetical protein n=1 Tax=Bradyrhizobium sp. CCBAU 51765 TaxID=1325102 RepID=UPI0018898616|nr:hypothetical protein [Bradyrhizobium sp. CCBAU 51765]QOZ06650.1 hypothetical protein XH96_03290 [Bradyrhizobium sp. CCBAU 51765]